MVFVADALGGWLVGQLADAGRKKLTELVLGGEQERALQRAADAAVWATAEEMSPSGGEQAGQLAMVISEVFRDPVPDAPLAGPVMLLEGLQAGIAGQLAVLDDAGLTGTGQSSADVLGVPGSVLADRPLPLRLADSSYLCAIRAARCGTQPPGCTFRIRRVTPQGRALRGMRPRTGRYECRHHSRPTVVAGVNNRRLGYSFNRSCQLRGLLWDGSISAG